MIGRVRRDPSLKRGGIAERSGLARELELRPYRRDLGVGSGGLGQHRQGLTGASEVLPGDLHAGEAEDRRDRLRLRLEHRAETIGGAGDIALGEELLALLYQLLSVRWAGRA